ncbi:hypothetical protein AcV7_008835 [Taiwanofungus camphoratus]|nr:hypothetical protein AcW2_004673 [Antrodia cinnamomea]KAI0950331.1 hypothetical protein AcV7_008835 [Antrodia cinnamomea]
MNEPAPPPTSHVLRPHHVNLMRILMLTYHHEHGSAPPLPPPFLLHVYRNVLVEVAEVTEPKSFYALYSDLMRGPMTDMPGPKKFLHDVGITPVHLQHPEKLADFFQGTPILFLDKDEEEPSKFHRRSLFGYFCRRCFVSYLKLSFGAVIRLQKDYIGWFLHSSKVLHDGKPSVGPPPGYRPVRKDRLTNDYQIFETLVDKKQRAVPDAYALFEKGQAVGDENIATENLRRFFEQHFHEGNDSGLRQHALFNLARRHYLNHEYVTCRKFLQEAIGVARTSSDRITLQHCMSMLRRLPPLERGRKAILNDIQPDLHPLEILYDVKKFMQIGNQQPLTASFEKIVQAMGLYDHWVDVQGGAFVEAEQWGYHAVQSVVWSMHGCIKLSEIEENIVTAFTEVGGDDNNRMIVTLNRGYYRARQGRYEDAIAMLLEPDVWRGLTLNDYNVWACQIWHILVLRASRRGQERQFADFLRQKRPHGQYMDREYWFRPGDPLGSMIRDPLYEVMQMRGVDQMHTCIEQLLTALWHAEFQCRYGLYRTAIILLADIGLEFGMTKWCRRLIDEIMPQIINGNELEQRALACFTLARCIIAAGDASAESLRECLPYLLLAEKDYVALQIFSSLQDVQYLLSVVYHNLGMTDERDDAASRHQSTEEVRKIASAVVIEEWVVDVWEIVAEVGAALAAR